MKISLKWTRRRREFEVRTKTHGQREFEERIKSVGFRLIGLICLVGAIAIGLLFWTIFHGSYHRWHSLIVMGCFCATQMLMVGGFIYFNAQRNIHLLAQRTQSGNGGASA